LSFNILDQNFYYCLYISKTQLSCVLTWVCWGCDVTVIHDVMAFKPKQFGVLVQRTENQARCCITVFQFLVGFTKAMPYGI